MYAVCSGICMLCVVVYVCCVLWYMYAVCSGICMLCVVVYVCCVLWYAV